MTTTNLTATVLCIASLACIANAQEPELYYKFDRGIGGKAINYGTAKVDSSMVAVGSAWTGGRWGKALRGSPSDSGNNYAYCDTGYRGSVSGSLTVSFNVKRNYPERGISYLFGVPVNQGFRCFTGGLSTELVVRGWGGQVSGGRTDEIHLPVVGGIKFRTRAGNAKGVSVALVIDGVRRQAQWYVDGLIHGAAIRLRFGANLSFSNLLIGKQASSTSSCVYRIDGFRFARRAVRFLEIQAWHLRKQAATGTLAQSCGVTLTESFRVGRPVAGNSRYALDFDGPAGMRYLFALSTVKTRGFDMGSRFPGLLKCLWYVDLNQYVILQTSSSGRGSIPLPLASNWHQIAAEAQILAVAGGKFYQSNLVSIVVERQ